MQLLWSKPIPCRNPWEPQLQGVFAHHAGEPAFFWLEYGGSMHVMLLTAERGLLRRLPPVTGLSLPRHWRLLEECSLLQLTDSHALDLNTLQLIPHDLPTPRKEAYPSFTLGITASTTMPVTSSSAPTAARWRGPSKSRLTCIRLCCRGRI